MRRKAYKKGAPGIVEVANRAEVSAATVSRFFNHPKMVRGNTRARIEKAATDLGYIRDRMAGSMHNRFSGTIGLIVPTINNAIFAEMIEAISSQLLRHDRTTLIASHNYDLTMEVSIVRSLLERRIDGVVIVGNDHSNSALDMLNLRQVPIVSVWNYHKTEQMSCVGADNQEAARRVTDHLLKLGHTDIAFLFPDTEGNDRARDRLEGAMRALKSNGLVVAENRLVRCPYNVPEAKRIALELLQNERRPTAVACANDVIAQGVIYACHHLELSIPRDVSITGIGDFAGASDIEPALTTIRLPAKRIGVQAADLIIRHCEADMPNLEHVKIDTELIVRQSTAAPRTGIVNQSSRTNSA